MENKPKKLLDQTRDILRVKHYAHKTEQSYINWIKRYILFQRTRHLCKMGRQQIEEFLTHLAVKERVASSTQNQALSAILFLYRDVLRFEGCGSVAAPQTKRADLIGSLFFIVRAR